MRIKDISRIKGREVITIKPHASISETLRQLVNNKIGAMPVCDFKGTLLGIISERDIIRWLHRGNTDTARTQVKDIMTYKVFTADPEDKLDIVLKTMTEKGIRHMPVMAGTRCVGILSLRDVIEQQVRNTPVRTEAREEYVAVSAAEPAKKPGVKVPSLT
ncbi:MAG: CBS domain-containing protein [Dehalococcoidales bacterium]